MSNEETYQAGLQTSHAAGLDAVYEAGYQAGVAATTPPHVLTAAEKRAAAKAADEDEG